MAKHKSVKERRKENHAAIMEDVLGIAREMMKKDGVGALSFNAIARELGIKPPSLYTYFDSKNAIYDMIFRRGFEEFGRVVEAEIDINAPADIVLKKSIRSYMQFAYDNPDLFQLMFQRPVPDFVPSEASMAVSLTILQQSREMTAQFIQNNMIDLQISVEQAHDLLIVISHGLTALHMANHPELPIGEGRFGQLIDVAVEMIIKAWIKQD